MGDTVFCVLNLPDSVDDEEITRYADSVIMRRVESVFGRCSAYYTVEHGESRNHRHLNILYQFGQTIDKEILLGILKSITTLTDITTMYVNNTEAMIDYMTKEDDCYIADGGSTDELRDEDVYRIQNLLNRTGNVQRRKRPRENDSAGPSAKRPREHVNRADMLLEHVDGLLNNGLHSVNAISTHYWNMRAKSREGASMFRLYTQNANKVKMHVTQFLKMTSKQSAKADNLAMPYSTYGKWYECMQIIGKRRGIDFMRRLSMLLLPRDRVLDNSTAVVCVGPPRCGKSWCTLWAEWLDTLVHLKIKEVGVGKYEALLYNEICVFDDPECGEWLDDRQTIANIMTGHNCSVKVYSATEMIVKPVHIMVKCNELPPTAEDQHSMLGRRLDIYSFSPCDIREPIPEDYNYLLCLKYFVNARDHLIRYRMPCSCAALFEDSRKWCFVRKRGDPLLLCGRSVEELQTESERVVKEFTDHGGIVDCTFLKRNIPMRCTEEPQEATQTEH